MTSVVGQGWAPQAVDIEWYLSRQKNLQGAGLDPAVVPGAVHAALTVLERWGTMSFEQVAAPAIDYAERGFPLRPRTADAIRSQREFLEKWPGNKTLLAEARRVVLRAGDTVKLPALAGTLKRMVRAERAAKSQGRRAGVIAARNRFYKGDIAREMVAFLQKHQAPFDRSRLRGLLRARRSARVRPPITATRSTSTRSAARARCCSRRSTSSSTSTCTRWATAAPTTSTPSSRR